MKKIRFIMTMVILLWVGSTVSTYAQETAIRVINIPALKELVALDPFKITQQQGQSFNPTLGVNVYFEDGTTLTGDQFIQKVQDPNYIPVPYVKKENPNIVVAMLVRKSSADEKEAKEIRRKQAGAMEVQNLGDQEDQHNPEFMKPIEFDPNTKYEEFTKGLRKIEKKPGDPQKMGGSFFNPTRIAFFDPEGKFVSWKPKDDAEAAKNNGLSKEVNEYFFNVKEWVKGEIFVDENNTVKAIKFRKSTMEERKNAGTVTGSVVNMDDAGSAMSSSAKLDLSFGDESSEKKLVGSKAPAINATDINGKEFNLANTKGKVVVLNFWFIECVPCKIEMPALNKLVDTYKGQDVEFIGIANNNKEALMKFLKTTEFKYRIIPNGLSIANTWSVGGFPTNVVIDKKGKVTFLEMGFIEDIEANLKAKIEEALKK